MTAPDHLPLADVKNRLSEVVERVEHEQGRVVITKYGRPAAVLLSVDDLSSLEETLDVLADATLLAKIRQGIADVDAGKSLRLDKTEALALIQKGE